MVVLIVTIIFISSLLGILIIFLRKAPLLVELPEIVEKPRKESLGLKLKEGVKNILPEAKLLQKILSRFRILTLKIEKKIDNLLQKLRKKSQEEKKEKENGNKIVQEMQPIQTKTLEQEDTNPPTGGLPPTTPE